jgi:hypothetical protein
VTDGRAATAACEDTPAADPTASARVTDEQKVLFILIGMVLG